MKAQVSKVYSHDDKFRLVVMCESNKKGYEFINEREAYKARARVIKRLKKDGFTVYL